MTRQERAAFNRLEKRRYELFTALAIIHTWIQINDDPHELLYRVAKFCTEKLEADKYAARKEAQIEYHT